MFVVSKRESGAIASKLEPPLQRDLGLRGKAAAAVRKAANMRWTNDQESDSPATDALERLRGS